MDSLWGASAPEVGWVASLLLIQQQLQVEPSTEEKLHEQELLADRQASPALPLAATLPVSAAAIAAAESAAAFAVEATAAAVVVASAGAAPVAAAAVAAVVSSSLAVVAAA